MADKKLDAIRERIMESGEVNTYPPEHALDDICYLIHLVEKPMVLRQSGKMPKLYTQDAMTGKLTEYREEDWL